MFFPVAGDPYYSSVSLLLPMTGANGGTTFTDVSPSPKTITRYNAITSTTQSKWGNGSGYFDGTEDYLSTPDSNDFNFGSGDFCIEAWIYITNTTYSENKLIYDQRSDDGSSNICCYMYYNYVTSTITISMSVDGTTSAYTLTSDIILSKGNWFHIAAVRRGSTVYLYVNGTVDTATLNVTGITLYNSTAAVKIGGRGDGLRSWNGYLQDVRVTKGTAHYSANFVVPSGPLPTRTLESPVHRRIVQQPSYHTIARLGL